MVKDIPSLSTLPSSSHTKEYRAAVRAFVEMIQARAKPKQVDATLATGALLADLIEKWADNINVPIGNFMGLSLSLSLSLSYGSLSLSLSLSLPPSLYYVYIIYIYIGNSAAALLDHVLFKEVGRVVVKYDKAMSMVAIPWAEGDILALHHTTMASLVGGLPERLRSAIEQVVKERLKKLIQENKDYYLATLSTVLSNFNRSVPLNFTNLTAPGQPASSPKDIEKVVRDTLLSFEDAVRRALMLPFDAALSEANVPGWSAGVSALGATLEYQRARVYRRNGVREAVRVLHMCSENLQEGELERLVRANVSTTKFEEDLEVFDKRCGQEARRRAKAYIFQNLTADHPLSPPVAKIVEAEAIAQITKYVGKAHLRRRAIQDFIKCAAYAGLPLEPAVLDACALSAVKHCRGPLGETLCTITEELEALSKTLGLLNMAQSEEACIEEGNKIVASYRERSENWWKLDSGSSWHSFARLTPLLEREWQTGKCRGPASVSAARKALRAQAAAELKKMCGMRSIAVDIALAVCWGICILRLLYCVSHSCCSADVLDQHKESKRTRELSCWLWFMSVVLLQTLLIALVLSILAPHAVWRLQLSRQLPVLNLKFDEPDDDSVSMMHMALCNLLLIQLAMSCDNCCRARKLRAKALSQRYNV
jgi:hypothetical protein